MHGPAKTVCLAVTVLFLAGLWIYARKTRSFYFLICAVLYGYAALTYLLLRLIYIGLNMRAFSAHIALAFWKRIGILDESDFQGMIQRIPLRFYRPNLFIRIGLFIFGSLAISACLGLVFLAASFFPSVNTEGDSLNPPPEPGGGGEFGGGGAQGRF